MRRTWIALIDLLVASFVVAHAAHAAPVADPAARTRALLADGRSRWEAGSLEQRRAAIALYEQAAQLEPRDTLVLGTLGRAYLDAHFFRQARTTFEHVLALAPNDADAEYGLGRAWTWTWLEKPDSAAFVYAYGYLTDATNDRPAFADAWIARAALDVERGDADAAREHGERAWRAAPDSPDAQVAFACLLYRAGDVERADSLFGAAIPQLPAARRRDYVDLTPLLSGDAADRWADLNPNEQAEAAERFWAMNDPDPTTPINEARLEFEARLAYASMLFGDPFEPYWRARTELYLRYGHRVQVEGESATGPHEMPRLELGEVATTPDPEALRRLGLQATTDGHAVFAPVPPGYHALPLATLVARFEGELGVRLLAEVQTPGTPADSLTATCVVLDSLGHERTRAARELGAAGCDPARQRIGDFAFDLDPGTYRVVFAVRNARAARGVSRTDVTLARPGRALEMSDIVLACGALDPASRQGAVRLNANLDARVGDDEPLNAYFEVYHLRAGAGGATRFEYEYTVLSTLPDRRPWYRRLLPGGPPALLSYRSEQQGTGALRREYIRVPAASLPYGTYRLEIAVRDLESGRRTQQSVAFAKEPASGGAPPAR